MKPEAVKHLRRAEELLEVASDNLEMGHFPDSVSRSYYGMLHAAKAVLLVLGIERSSHHGVWAAFGQSVARPGLMDSQLHRTALEAFQSRVRSDYLAEPGDTREDAEDDLAVARDFVAACGTFLGNR
jgi:uncharacterized protein (UPF0332 family)